MCTHPFICTADTYMYLWFVYLSTYDSMDSVYVYGLYIYLCMTLWIRALIQQYLCERTYDVCLLHLYNSLVACTFSCDRGAGSVGL